MRYALPLAALLLAGCVTDSQRYKDDTGAEYQRDLIGFGYRVDKDVAGATLQWNPVNADGSGGGGSATIGKESEGVDTLEAFQTGVAATTGVINGLVGVLGPSVGAAIERSAQPEPQRPRVDPALVEAIVEALRERE